jgi:hypothetical protein
MVLDAVHEIRLPWSDDDGISLGADGADSTLNSWFVGSGGRLYVVDYPSYRSGARVRWFRDGVLDGQHEAPPGSVFFEAHDGGLRYLLAKSAGPSEQAVFVDAEGSVTATYTIPLEVNSGGFVQLGQDTWAVAWSSEIDSGNNSLKANDYLLPVVIDGEQVSDSQARDLARDGSTALADGTILTRSLDGQVRDDGSWLIRQFLTWEDLGAKVEIPSEAKLVGTDSRGRSWIVLPPEPLDRRSVAGWPAEWDPSALLVCLTPSGETAATMLAPYVPQLGEAATPRVSADYLYVTYADAREVVCVAYRIPE